MTEAVLSCQCKEFGCHHPPTWEAEKTTFPEMIMCSMPIHPEDRGTTIRKCRACMAHTARHVTGQLLRPTLKEYFLHTASPPRDPRPMFHHRYANTELDEMWALGEAVKAAKESPCQKSARGVIIWDPNIRVGCHYVTATNHLPFGYGCTGSATCKQVCSEACIHAEEQAIFNWFNGPQKESGMQIRFTELLHIKYDRTLDAAMPSKASSCVSCAKIILDLGIKVVWLLLESGFKPYTAKEFFEEAIRNYTPQGQFLLEELKETWKSQLKK